MGNSAIAISGMWVNVEILGDKAEVDDTVPPVGTLNPVGAVKARVSGRKGCAIPPSRSIITASWEGPPNFSPMLN